MALHAWCRYYQRAFFFGQKGRLSAVLEKAGSRPETRSDGGFEMTPETVRGGICSTLHWLPLVHVLKQILRLLFLSVSLFTMYAVARRRSACDGIKRPGFTGATSASPNSDRLLSDERKVPGIDRTSDVAKAFLLHASVGARVSDLAAGCLELDGDSRSDLCTLRLDHYWAGSDV